MMGRTKASVWGVVWLPYGGTHSIPRTTSLIALPVLH